MNSKLKEFLKTRKIAPIVAKSAERDNEMALKVMCVFDHFLEKSGLFSHLEKQPKLFNQLLNFKSFASFNYWKYFKPQKFNKEYVLVCRVCKLVGPYYLILSHMATTHNTHVGCKKCVWCNDVDIRTHIDNNTLERCYNQYLLQQNIVENAIVSNVIVKFYGIILDIAKSLGVLHCRDRCYTGIGRKRRENLTKPDEEGDIDNSVIVYEKCEITKIDPETLDNLYFMVEAYNDNSAISPNVPSRKRPPNKDRKTVSEKKKKSNDERLPNTSTKSNTPLKVNAQLSRRTSTALFKQTQSNNNIPIRSAVITSEKSAMSIGSIIDQIIKSIPDDKMKQNAILKVHSVALDCFKAACEGTEQSK